MTMRIFLYEYANAVGLECPPSLKAEGWAMLSAVVDDFSRLRGIQTLTLLHQTCRQALGHDCLHVNRDEEEAAFCRRASQADFTLVVAPETGNVLAQRSRWALDCGGRLLGPSPEAIELTGDKLALHRFLLEQGIGTPRTIDLSGRLPEQVDSWFPAVCKPRDGAGSQATGLVRSWTELAAFLVQAKEELPGSEFILQPHVAGTAVSVAFLKRTGAALALQPCLQILSGEGRFHYLGGELPMPADLAGRAIDLASWAIDSVPGLQGYAGVDLVLGEPNDGSVDHVIEMNPRLTTSYIGLRRLARCNLAEAMLAIVLGRDVPRIEWNRGPIRFWAAGRVQ